MKLGNHGWGMREMIIYLCVFAIILIFVAISINSLYKKIEKDNDAQKNNQPVVVEPVQEQQKNDSDIAKQRTVDYTYYHNMEVKVYNATIKYLSDNPTYTGKGIFRIDEDTLVGLGYMNKIYNDIGTSPCTAYSNVYVQEGDASYTVKSYVRCDNYTSEGY